MSPEFLHKMAQTGHLDRVAYPSITTIYPPITQLIFGLHHLVSPWNLDVWRLFLLTADTATLLLLFRLLNVIGRPGALAMIFWLNPLLITETINAGHMDALLLPVLTGAALCLVTYRFQIAAVLLALGVGLKLWPIIFVPVFIAYWYKNAAFLWRNILWFSVTAIVISGLILVPQLSSKLTDATGLVAYSTQWQTNSMLFQWVNNFTEALSFVDSGLASRVVVGLMFIFVLGLLCLNHQTKPMQNLLLASAALFLLSPTGYPWYFLWLFPWLAIHPHRALLCLTATLPLYDLRFSPAFDAAPYWFELVIIPIQFAPIFILGLIDSKTDNKTRILNASNLQYAR